MTVVLSSETRRQAGPLVLAAETPIRTSLGLARLTKQELI